MTVLALFIQDPSLLMTPRGWGVLCLVSAIAVVILWRSFRAAERPKTLAKASG